MVLKVYRKENLSHEYWRLVILLMKNIKKSRQATIMETF